MAVAVWTDPADSEFVRLATTSLRRRRPWTPTDVFTLDILRNYLLVGAALFVLGMLGFLSPPEPDRDVPLGRDDAAGTALTWSASAATTATGPARSSRS